MSRKILLDLAEVYISSSICWKNFLGEILVGRMNQKSEIDLILDSVNKNQIPRCSILKIISKHASDYFYIALGLGMDYFEVERIRQDYPRDCQMALCKIFHEYFLKEDKYTTRHLYNSLRFNEFNRSASEFIEMLRDLLSKEM